MKRPFVSVTLLLTFALACNLGGGIPATQPLPTPTPSGQVEESAAPTPVGAYPTAPSPTSAPTATLPPQGGPRFGITSLGAPFDCEVVTTIGAQAVWGTIFWDVSEPEPGVWDLEKVDAAIAEAEACGAEVSVKLRTGQGHWALQPVEDPAAVASEETGKRASSPPLSLDDYYNWVFAIAERYRGRVRAYGIENEVNTRSFWLGTYDEYEAMLETAYAAVKAADPDALVLDFGIASMTYGVAVARWRYEQGDVEGASAWINQYYARRGVGAVTTEDELRAALYDPEVEQTYDVMLRHFQRPDIYDVYQLHFYEAWDLLPELIQWINDRMAEYGAAKPIEAWEIGYADVDTTRYNPEAHGRDTAKVLVAALGEGVTRIYYLPYISHRPRQGLDEVWWGLADAEGQPRPAHFSYIQTSTALEGYTSAARLRAGPDEWVYQFDDVVARWTRDGDVVFETTPPAAPTAELVYAYHHQSLGICHETTAYLPHNACLANAGL